MEIIRLEEVSSTNAYLRERLHTLCAPVAVTAKYQTAGRGQRGNTWYSDSGANLLFSLLFRPAVDIHPRDQFSLSMAVSLAVTDMLADHDIHACVKWPNDIYVGDNKIAGILIENGFTGPRIEWSITGIGLNVNQTSFPAGIPNPVSMKQIKGSTYDTVILSEKLSHHLIQRLDTVEGYLQDAMDEYKSCLWRNDGEFHPFIDTDSGEQFSARIHDVESSGMLVVEDGPGNLRKYFFKEVSFVL